MFDEFIRGFFLGVQNKWQAPQREKYKPQMRRPSRRTMKRHLADQVAEDTQYRFNFFVDKTEYHAAHVYVRSAIYTAVYEYVGEREGHRFPKLVYFCSGSPGPRELQEYVRNEVLERQKRVDRAFTMER